MISGVAQARVPPTTEIKDWPGVRPAAALPGLLAEQAGTERPWAPAE